jgi:hypothetical protein
VAAGNVLDHFSPTMGLKQFCLLYGGQTSVNGKKVVVVPPAYNAAKTLKMTYQEISCALLMMLFSWTMQAGMVCPKWLKSLAS